MSTAVSTLTIDLHSDQTCRVHVLMMHTYKAAACSPNATSAIPREHKYGGMRLLHSQRTLSRASFCLNTVTRTAMYASKLCSRTGGRLSTEK